MAVETPVDPAEQIEILWLDGKAYAPDPKLGYLALELAEKPGATSCECWGWKKHCAGTLKLCRHLRALKLALSCPVCKGTGTVEGVTVNLITNKPSAVVRPCGACWGDGTRAAFDDTQRLKESEEPADALDGWRKMTNEQRLEVFR